MRILLVFIDMVRVDHLKTYNSDAKECCLDRRLAEIGGTIYTRCFSPGPDTPRSMACMQSGLYPFFNGCSTRIRWPFYFLKEGISTIWDHAAEKKMIVNLSILSHLTQRKTPVSGKRRAFLCTLYDNLSAITNNYNQNPYNFL